MIVKPDNNFYENLKKIAHTKGYERPDMCIKVFYSDFYDIGVENREEILFGFWGLRGGRLRYGKITYGDYLDYISDQREDKINRLLSD